MVADVVRCVGAHTAEVEVHLGGARRQGLDVLGDRSVGVVGIEVEGGLARRVRVDVEGVDLVVATCRVDVEVGMDVEVAGELVNGEVPVLAAGVAGGVKLPGRVALPVIVDVVVPLERVVVARLEVRERPVHLRGAGPNLEVVVLLVLRPVTVIVLHLQGDIAAVHAVGVRVEVVPGEVVPAGDVANGRELKPDVEVACELVDGEVPVSVFEQVVAAHIIGVAAVDVLTRGVEVEVVVRVVVEHAHVPKHGGRAVGEVGVVVNRRPRAVGG